MDEWTLLVKLKVPNECGREALDFGYLPEPAFNELVEALAEEKITRRDIRHVRYEEYDPIRENNALTNLSESGRSIEIHTRIH